MPENLESPEYIGRAVVALAGDANVVAKSGRVLTAGQLAAEYGFADVDGRQWPPFQIETGRYTAAGRGRRRIHRPVVGVQARCANPASCVQ